MKKIFIITQINSRIGLNYIHFRKKKSSFPNLFSTESWALNKKRKKKTDSDTRKKIPTIFSGITRQQQRAPTKTNEDKQINPKI